MFEPLDLLLGGRLPARPLEKASGNDDKTKGRTDRKMKKLRDELGDWLVKEADGGYRCSACQLILGLTSKQILNCSLSLKAYLCIVIWGTRLFDFVGLAVVDSGLGHPASSHAGSGNMPAVMLTKQLC